jgi:hypothetical protein
MVLVESMLKGIHRCVVHEGSSTSILSSLAWKALYCPKIVSSTSELLDFDRKPSECLGIIPQLPITLGGKTVLVNLFVVSGLLEFNMLLGHDCLSYEGCGVYSLSCDVFPSQWNHYQH